MAAKLQSEVPRRICSPKKSEKSAICRDIELKFGIGTNFGPLS